MILSENAEENDANQSKFYRIVSSEPVTDARVLFDTLSNFLMKDKKRQISSGYLDEKDQIVSRLTWNNLRNVANAVLDEGCLHREPIPAWVEQKEPIVIDNDSETLQDFTSDTAIETSDSKPSPQQPMYLGNKISPPGIGSERGKKQEEKRSAKKAKREAKEARKRERAERREAKKARKEEKAAKKIRKEAKKRKREDSGDS